MKILGVPWLKGEILLSLLLLTQSSFIKKKNQIVRKVCFQQVSSTLSRAEKSIP